MLARKDGEFTIIIEDGVRGFRMHVGSLDDLDTCKMILHYFERRILAKELLRDFADVEKIAERGE
jgi:hypothetical protein